jgi:hypothetical protein
MCPLRPLSTWLPVVFCIVFRQPSVEAIFAFLFLEQPRSDPRLKVFVKVNALSAEAVGEVHVRRGHLGAVEVGGRGRRTVKGKGAAQNKSVWMFRGRF